MGTAQTTEPPKATRQTMTVRCIFCQTWNRVDAARVVNRPKCGKCGKPMLLDRPLRLDDDTFDRTVNETEVPVLVDFYADWCGPCKIMAPSVDKLAGEYVGKALITKLDTDHAQKTALRFQIRGIPTTMVFLKGKEVARQSGALPYDQLAQMLKAALGAETAGSP
jgi:thioredoxin 2